MENSTALLDQRMRADRHKANFESLKAQHLTLQEVSTVNFNSKDTSDVLRQNQDSEKLISGWGSIFTCPKNIHTPVKMPIWMLIFT